MPSAYARALEPDTVVARHTPRPSPRQLFVVRARVGTDRRVVAVDTPVAPIDPRIGACARELARRGTLRPGTSLRAVYADALGHDETASAGTLVAVEIGSGRDAVRAYALGDGREFYTADGKPLGAAMLRFPLPFVAVTSGFDPARRHPVFGRRKPHLGVDFAARRGTPVLAVADGEIVEAGWAGGFGKQVRIVHEGGFESGYAHLERYGPLVVESARVRKGEVIGYVGTTGITTGPHLHFTLTRSGRHVDPLTVALPARSRLEGNVLARLAATATEVDLALARFEQAGDGRIQIASIVPYR